MSLSIQDAKGLIAEVKEREIALGRAPETWYTYENHVYGVANVARTIASKIKGMDEEQAYVNALLHDVCRTNERQIGRFHGVLGYEKLIDKDESAARSALLHMFLGNKLKPFEECSQMFFDNRSDYDFVADYVNHTTVTDEDLLIQLADNLSNKNGFVTIEERARDLSERKGISLDKEWLDMRYELKKYFDKKVGTDIYNLFRKINIPSRER